MNTQNGYPIKQNDTQKNTLPNYDLPNTLYDI